MNNFENKKFINREGGFITYIVLIVALLVLIAYFRSDIVKFWQSPGVKDAILTAIGWIQQALAWIMNKLSWTSSQIK